MGYPHPIHERETPVLSQHFGDPAATSLEGWRKRGGYRGLERALTMDPTAITTLVKDSGLRGRGGAGFPTGVKWSFLKPDGRPHYLCCNADESEPGTFKDREIMRWTPHALIEGCAIACHAMYAETCYIYIRGEFTEPIERMEAALKEARAAGIIGKNAMGSGRTINVWVHKGAGAFGQPTTVNNVETLAAVPPILVNGAEWYKGFSRPDNPKSTGTKLYSVCGNIVRPGNYEVPMGFPFRDFLYELCGGPQPGRRFRAIIPGGASVPIQTIEEAEATLMDYEGVVAKGSMLGSGGVIVIDDAQNLVKQIARLARFYAHESCAQCTQCREGTAWTTKILERMVAGEGTAEDLDTLLSIADDMTGKTICVLSDSCATPVVSGINKFREDFETLIKRRTVHPVPAAVA